MGVKTVTRTVLVLAVVLCVSSCLVGRYMCNYSLLPAEHGNDLEGDRTKTESRYPGIVAWYDSLHNRGVFRDTTLIGENGYRLHAVFAPACRPAEAEGSAVVVHGYTDNHICFLNLVRMYRDSLNYNVMVPDLHYHGLCPCRQVSISCNLFIFRTRHTLLWKTYNRRTKVKRLIPRLRI